MTGLPGGRMLPTAPLILSCDRTPGDLLRSSCASLGIAGLLLIAGSSASAADEYYIVRDAATKRCAIVDSPPTTTELILLDNGKLHTDRSEAERVMASLPCTAARSASAPARATPNTARAEKRGGSVKARSRPAVSASPEPKHARSASPVLNWLQRLSIF
jgi:hypothetical protein